MALPQTSNLELISCYDQSFCHFISKTLKGFLSQGARLASPWVGEGNLHGSLPWTPWLLGREKNQRDLSRPLWVWFGIEEDGDGDQASARFSNLYPPLTLAPSVWLGSGHWSIPHSEPPRNISKLSPIYNKKVLLIKRSLSHSPVLPRICLPPFLPFLLIFLSLWSIVLSSHLEGKKELTFWNFPKFPYSSLMRFGLESDSVMLWANWTKSGPTSYSLQIFGWIRSWSFLNRILELHFASQEIYIHTWYIYFQPSPCPSLGASTPCVTYCFSTVCSFSFQSLTR